MATTTALPEALRRFLMSCTPDHAHQIVQTLQEALRQNDVGGTPNAAPNMTAKTGLKAVKTGKKQRNKKEKSEKTAGGPKRPLNSWMAFRKYYSASLAPRTQKAISRILMTWWRGDPFDGKWAILAKAYSVVRGSREKEDVPLDGFFHHCAPLIGVIPPNQYMHVMGWQLGPPKDDDPDKLPQVTRVFVPDLSTFPTTFTTTNLSVNDLVEHCKAVGYARPNNSGSQTTCAQDGLTMVVYRPIPPPVGTNPRATMDEDGNIAEALSPFSRKLFSNLQVALAAPPAGMTVLSNATVAVDNAGADPYIKMFDPTSHFDVSFNPSDDADNAWDAYDLNANVVAEDVLKIPFDDFIDYSGSGDSV